MKNQLLLICLLLSISSSCCFSQKRGKQGVSKNVNAVSNDTLNYLYQTSVKINSVIIPYFEALNKPQKKEDTLKLDKCIKEKNELIKINDSLVDQIKKNRNQIYLDSIKLASITTIYKDAVKDIRKQPYSGTIDVLSKLNPVPTNISFSDLSEFIELSKILHSAKRIIEEDYKDSVTLKKQIYEFRNTLNKFSNFSELKKEAEKLNEKLEKYPLKINQCYDHLKRYYVTWISFTVGERINYLREYLQSFKDYPFLLNILFSSIENPSGNNPLKLK